MTPEHEFAIAWWKRKHGDGTRYFPDMDQHRNWHIYTEEDLWLKDAVTLSTRDICLEIGCGYGQWMIPLSYHVAEVYGFDIHPYLKTKAEEKFVEHGRTNCFVLTGDGANIPFEPKWNDPRPSLIYSISVFQHMPRSAVLNYLQQARKILATGGRGMFHFRHATPNHADGPYADDIKNGHEGDWSVGWSVDQILAAALATGWEHARCQVLGQMVLLFAN